MNGVLDWIPFSAPTERKSNRKPPRRAPLHCLIAAPFDQIPHLFRICLLEFAEQVFSIQCHDQVLTKSQFQLTSPTIGP